MRGGVTRREVQPPPPPPHIPRPQRAGLQRRRSRAAAGGRRIRPAEKRLDKRRAAAYNADILSKDVDEESTRRELFQRAPAGEKG